MASYNYILSLMLFLRLSVANEIVVPSNEIAEDVAIHIQARDVPVETKQTRDPRLENGHSALAQTFSLLELKDQNAIRERLMALELNLDLARLKDFDDDDLDENSEIQNALKTSPGFEAVEKRTLLKQYVDLENSFDSTKDKTPTMLKDVYKDEEKSRASGPLTKANVTQDKDTEKPNSKTLFDMTKDTHNDAKKTYKTGSISNRKNAPGAVDKVSKSFLDIAKEKKQTDRKQNTIPHDDNNVEKSLKAQKVVRKRTFDGTSTCTMDTIETGMTFSETIRTAGGDAVLVCRGNVLVNKCEGMCNSNVWPDVNHYDGYQKECSCCRDASTRQRDVTLSECTIGEASVTGHFLARPIVEPASCSCLECRN